MNDMFVHQPPEHNVYGKNDNVEIEINKSFELNLKEGCECNVDDIINKLKM